MFVVSDSSDTTATILDDWVKTRDGTVIELGDLKERLPKRTGRLVHARNKGLEEVRRRGWSNYHHLVIADLDDVLCEPVSVVEFARAVRWLENGSKRASIFPNAMPRYYDIWALRHDTWCPGDCWHTIWGQRLNEAFCSAKMREVHARQIVIPPWLPPIRVRSAFGGLGIYKMQYAKAAEYAVDETSEFESSEHVGFNDQIAKAGGTLHIFPSLRVHAPPEHLFQPAEMPYYLQLAMHRLAFEEKDQTRQLIKFCLF